MKLPRLTLSSISFITSILIGFAGAFMSPFSLEQNADLGAQPQELVLQDQSSDDDLLEDETEGQRDQNDSAGLGIDSQQEEDEKLQGQEDSDESPDSGKETVSEDDTGDDSEDSSEAADDSKTKPETRSLMTSVSTPTLSVELSDGTVLNPGDKVYKGDVVRIKGTGFDAVGNPAGKGALNPGDPGGYYVVFGNFSKVWQPSVPGTNATNDRPVAVQRWALPDVSYNTSPNKDLLTSQRVVLTDDGSFDFEITLADPAASKVTPPDGSFGVFTYVAGGAPAVSAHELEFKLDYVSDQRPELEEPETEQEELAAGGLNWAIHSSFVNYVSGLSDGKITVFKPATKSGNIFSFVQTDRSKWDEKTNTGTVQYSGAVNFLGHDGAMDVTITDPYIKVTDSKTGELSVIFEGKRITLAKLDLTNAKIVTAADGSKEWQNVKVTLIKTGEPVFGGFYDANDKLSDLSFMVGSSSDEVTEKDDRPKDKGKQNPPATPEPVVRDRAQVGGSLVWGVSSEFAAYTTGRIATGQVTARGVGGGPGGYVFPQAVGGSWNPESQTGTVNYSGVVAFTGHHGLMVENFANPQIVVHSATSATLNVQGHSFGLNLAVAAKSQGLGGEVTWSGVPVSGLISGSGPGGGGSFPADPLTFTVGSAVSGFGSGEIITKYGEDDDKKDDAEEIEKNKQLKDDLDKQRAALESASEDSEGAQAAGVTDVDVAPIWMWVAGIALVGALGAASFGVYSRRPH